jgi:hypothetical protein
MTTKNEYKNTIVSNGDLISKKKIKTMINWQWYRAVIGTIAIISVMCFGFFLFTFQGVLFLKIWGILLISIIYFICLYINYNFIKWNDKKLKTETERVKNKI